MKNQAMKLEQKQNDGEFWVHFPDSDSTDLHITKAYDRINRSALGECRKVSLEVWGALVTLEQVKSVVCPDCLAEVSVK